MRRDKYEDERGSGGGGGSSWISYSDMMASLLLVFVLMLSVSLLKYFTAPKEEDIQKSQSIEERLKELEAKEAELESREKALEEAQAQLEKEQAELKAAQEQLEKDREELKAAQEQLEKDRAELKAAQEQLEKDRAELKAAQEQLEKEQAELKAAQEQLEKEQAELKAAQEQLEKDRAELRAAQELLEKDRAELQAAQDQLKTNRQALEQERAVLETEKAQLEKDQEALKNGQDQLLLDQAALKAEKNAFEKEKEALRTPEPTVTPVPDAEVLAYQEMIQRNHALLDLYYLQSHIIASQFDAFRNSGINVSINEDTGDVTTPNFILFDAGSSELKEEGKQFLDAFIPMYLDVLMRPEFENSISEIIIEGHTDSPFSTDQELSSRRAGSVMAYSLQIPTLTDGQRAFLLARASFTGRGYADPVLDKSGQVDREASRRVEIKYQIREDSFLAENEITLELKNRLDAAGVSVSVDPETGDILPEGVLFFDAESDVLTEDGKAFIRAFLPVCLDVMTQEEYRDRIGTLIIEGATDQPVLDEGSLNLSQRRAANVMEYCLQTELTESQKAWLQEKLTASGRNAAGSLQPSDVIGGRRVKFKLRLKNTNSLTELKKLLLDQ